MHTEEPKDHVDHIISQWHDQRPGLDVSSMGIFGRMARLTKLCDKARSEALAQLGFNDGEFDVMATLRRSGSPYTLSPTELYRSLMLTSGAITHRLTRLEAKAWIERVPNAHDRRGIAVRLTKKGLVIIDEAVITHLEAQKSMLIGLSPKKQVQLAAILKETMKILPSENFSSDLNDEAS